MCFTILPSFSAHEVPMTAKVAEALRGKSLFYAPPKPAYLNELRRSALLAPVTCVGDHCTSCNAPILYTETPMDFYQTEPVCMCDCMWETYEKDGENWEEDAEEDAEALDAYIDSVLDMDYDW